MADFDAFFFDVDGTLVESSGLMPQAFKDAFARAGLDISIDPWKGSGKVDYQITRIYLDGFDTLSEEAKDALAEQISVYETEEVIKKLQELGLKAMPGIPELLQALKEKGISFGLLTGNLQNIVRPKLTMAGLNFADFSYGGFGDHSPMRAVTAQRAVDSAADFLGFRPDPQRCLVIGDTPNDIDCARKIGAQVLVIPGSHYSMEELAACRPDYLLPGFSDTQAVLELFGA